MKQPTPTFQARATKSGKPEMPDYETEALRRWVRTFRPGTPLEIKIGKPKKKRSNEQNAYYWGVVIPILADYFGYDPEEMHEELKYLFNPIQSKIDPSRAIGGSTTKMSTVDFFFDEDSYIERICRWAAMEYSIYIPPPKRAGQ